MVVPLRLKIIVVGIAITAWPVVLWGVTIRSLGFFLLVSILLAGDFLVLDILSDYHLSQLINRQTHKRVSDKE